MSNFSWGKGPGWSSGRSIALELDVALSAAGPQMPEAHLTPELAVLAGSLPVDWRALWSEMLGAPRRWVSLLGHAALLAGVIAEEDYSRATLAMRELSVADALAAAVRLAGGASPCPSLPAEQQLVAVLEQVYVGAWHSLGVGGGRSFHGNADLRQLPRILRGGDLQHRFWHWVDRVYYEVYRPWREQRLPVMQAAEQRVAAGLGVGEGAEAGALPALRWLPAPNPLLIHPELAGAAQSGKVCLFFWADPFGLFDYWSSHPGLLVVTCHEPGALFDHFRQDATAVAERVKALADPTRLMLLRIIRHFALDNTQMADYLGVARPTVSVHAKLLREAGLIETGNRGRQAVHSINASEVRRLFADLERFLDLPEEEA